MAPLSGSQAACPASVVTAQFSETMNPATINGATFLLAGPGTTAVAGAVTYNAASNTATFTPSAFLSPAVTYTGTVAVGALDVYGNALAQPYVWSFKTAANSCAPPPVVTAFAPAAGSLTACPNAVVSVTFNEAMNPASINASDFTLSGGITGTVSHNTANTVFTLTPSTPLTAGQTYVATVTTAAMDTFTNNLPANYVSSFTTAANACMPPPTVIAFAPTAGSLTACPNAAVSVTFSEAMNPATINSADFTLAPGVIGTVTHNANNTVFTLTPSSNLAASKVYTATITQGAQDTFGNPLANVFTSSFTTAANSCMPPPTVVSVTAPNLATGVCPNKVLTATFSEALDATAISNTTFLLTGPGTTPVTGTVSYAAATKQVIFAPSAVLALNTTYTATITTGVKDLFGNNLAAPYTWSFTTGANPCVPAPPPISTTPAIGALAICPNSVITATYGQAMNPASINATSFLVNVTGGAAVTGTVTANAQGTVFSFTPTAALALSTGYTLTLTTAAQDVFGNAMAANYVSTFTTGAISCVTVTPTVSNVTPTNNSMGVCPNSVATATFTTAMNPLTLNANTFTLAPNVTGVVTMDATDKVATFTPTSPLAVNTNYIATITTGAQSTGGSPLGANYNWNFTTSAQACQPAVNLGSAANYGILASATVTNTGPTIITGENLGLSPGTSVTGFPPGTIVLPSILDITTTSAAQGELDATIAYNYMAGLQNAAVLPSELSGLTLTPGLYKNASSVTLTSGNLTLDAQGNPNAVFIFQIGSSFVTLGGTQIILAGGAQAKNVFWQVGSSATLGTNSFFEGNILAYSSVTLNTGVNLVGRVMALNGAVTLDSDIITAP